MRGGRRRSSCGVSGGARGGPLRRAEERTQDTRNPGGDTIQQDSTAQHRQTGRQAGKQASRQVRRPHRGGERKHLWIMTERGLRDGSPGELAIPSPLDTALPSQRTRRAHAVHKISTAPSRCHRSEAYGIIPLAGSMREGLRIQTRARLERRSTSLPPAW